MAEQLDRDSLSGLQCNSFSFYVRMRDILGRCRWRNGVPLQCYDAEAIDAATVALGGWHGDVGGCCIW